jgi:hypothetical protein
MKLGKLRSLLLLWLAACGNDDAAGGDGASGGDGDGDGGNVTLTDARALPDGTMFVFPDDLEGATGCDGPFNPDQILTFRISTSNWSSIQNDATAETYYAATFACGDEAPINVGVRRRRSGAGDKFGIKIDINWATAGQEWRTLKKLSLDVGAGAFAPADMGGLVREYVAWRAHRLAGHRVSRSSMVHLFVNGNDMGVYSNIEDVDKRFLQSRLGDDSGWLYKISGGPDDGYRTNETVPNPYEAPWCIFENNPCPSPSDLETWLPEHLAIGQLLAVGGVNGIIGNADAPIAKRNNFYSYDYPGLRFYFPWDLDSAWNGDVPLFPAGGGSAAERQSEFQSILFTHWADDYDALLGELLAGPLSVASVHAEMDRVLAVDGAAIDADPILSGSASSIIGDLKSWYTSRHAAASAQVAAH